MSEFQGGGSIALPYASGRYYTPDGTVVANGNSFPTALIRMVPGYIRRTVTISQLLARVTTAVASSNFQIAIYASDPVTGLPTGNPVYSSGSLSGASAAVVTQAVSLTLPAGLYWWAVNVDANGAGIAFQASNAQSYHQSAVGLGANTNLLAGMYGYLKNQAYNSWPTLTGNEATDVLTEASNFSSCLIGFKVA